MKNTIDAAKFNVIIEDPSITRFKIILRCPYTEEYRQEQKCIGDGDLCCIATFRGLGDEEIDNIVEDLRRHQGSSLDGLSDPDTMLLGRVLVSITSKRTGADWGRMNVNGMLPLIINPHVKSHLYDAYVKTVPSVVDMMLEKNVHLPIGKSIIDACDACDDIPVGDDESEASREDDIE